MRFSNNLLHVMSCAHPAIPPPLLRAQNGNNSKMGQPIGKISSMCYLKKDENVEEPDKTGLEAFQ